MYRMKIQDVAFDGKRVLAKGRTVADIRDRLKVFAVDAHLRHVYAKGRGELIVAREVDGWNRIFRAVSAPAPRWGIDAEYAPEQMAGRVHLASEHHRPHVA